ncbi:MAG: MerR family transcriptional regulator [Actinomycetaceae bacterium]|nr:MerR family transcriptional regulator [Actinomycetaceae bacterium]
MNQKSTYSVGQVADLMGVSVRQLHHWDALGLAPASQRSPAGYRRYTEADIERLQQALVYRETGMALQTIKDTLDSSRGPAEHLAAQLELLTEAQTQLAHKIRAVKELLEKTMNNMSLTSEEKARILGGDWDPSWDDEARERWGETAQWQTAAKMGRADWEGFKASNDAVEKKMVAAMQAGIRADSAQAMALAEEHRAALSLMYPVSHCQHVLLGRMYEADERFSRRYESYCEGLTAWLVAAINANAIAHGADPSTATWE